MRYLQFSPDLPKYLTQDCKLAAARRARLRLGCSGLNESRARRRLTPTADCPDCKGAIEDADHVATVCPRWAAARHECNMELSVHGLVLNAELLMGGTEPDDGENEAKAPRPDPAVRRAALKATERFLLKISRIGPTRRQ